MRYTEQIKYSWGYHWGIFRELWDMFTLRNWHWFIGGLLVVLCIVPQIMGLLFSTTEYYVTTPIPSFTPSLTQELAITVYCSKAMPAPSILAVVSYYWVKGSGFKFMTNVLCIVTSGLLIIAYLREGNPVRDREE